MVAGSSGSPASQIRTASTSCSGSAFWLCRVSPRARGAVVSPGLDRRRLGRSLVGGPPSGGGSVLLPVFGLGHALAGGLRALVRSCAGAAGGWLVTIGWGGPA